MTRDKKDSRERRKTVGVGNEVQLTKEADKEPKK